MLLFKLFIKNNHGCIGRIFQTYFFSSYFDMSNIIYPLYPAVFFLGMIFKYDWSLNYQSDDLAIIFFQT